MKIGKISNVLNIFRNLEKNNSNSVFLSGRIKISRNLQGFIFPDSANDLQKTQVLDKLINFFQSESLFGNHLFFLLESLSKNELETLISLNLLPPETNTTNSESKALILSPNCENGILINGNDHLKIFFQFTENSFTNKIEATKIFMDFLSQKLHFAKGKQNFYLTSNVNFCGEAVSVSLLIDLETFLDKSQAANFISRLQNRSYFFKQFNNYQFFGFVTIKLRPEEKFEELVFHYENLLSFLKGEAEKWISFSKTTENEIFFRDRFIKAKSVLENALLLHWQEGIAILSVYFSEGKITSEQLSNYFYLTLPALLTSKNNEKLVDLAQKRASFLREKLNFN